MHAYTSFFPRFTFSRSGTSTGQGRRWSVLTRYIPPPPCLTRLSTPSPPTLAHARATYVSADGAERPGVLWNLCGGFLLHGRQHVSLPAQMRRSGLLLPGGVVGAVGSIGWVLRRAYRSRGRPSGETFDASGLNKNTRT